MIRLGDQDIDFSPSFVVYLTTRDASARFTPDLCSRVTLVIFTVTRPGLSAQCLSQLLLAERPDVEARREAALKQQGETRVALRAKEKQLLDSISGMSQSLLQDDQAVLRLQALKSEAAVMMSQAEASEGVMAEVRAAQEQYQGAAERCASLFFAVEGLSLVNFLYQVSLHHFQACYTLAVKEEGSSGIEKRLARLLYNRISRGLLEVHRPALALRLALAIMADNTTQAELDLPVCPTWSSGLCVVVFGYNFGVGSIQCERRMGFIAQVARLRVTRVGLVEACVHAQLGME